MIDSTVLVITLGSFVAAFINGAFATGGIYIILFASTSVLPISAAIPLQSVFSAASLLGRIYYFWQHIDWRIMRMFTIGCLFGVVLGTKTFVTMPDTAILTLLGVILLTLIWAPTLKWQIPLKHPFLFVGGIHSYLGALFGVGGVLQSVVLRTGLTKLEITGTLAASLMALDVMKVLSYTSYGFNYLDYLPHIIGATFAGVLGTLAGKRVTHHVSEKLFRTVFRFLVTVIALRMIYKGLASG